MAYSEFRTYKRRKTTRESGYHTCEFTTGGECYVSKTEYIRCPGKKQTLKFCIDKCKAFNIFESSNALLAFGGYIYSEEDAVAIIELSYEYENEKYNADEELMLRLDKQTWKNLGIHTFAKINKERYFYNLTVKIDINYKKETNIHFLSVDMGCVDYEVFTDKTLKDSFMTKTNLAIPSIYYFKTDNKLSKFLTTKVSISEGFDMVYKSCNRCGRFLPEDVIKEDSPLNFGIHCKKNAPCTHSSFCAYEIINLKDLDDESLDEFNISKDDKISSYYGHQLECKACKKFFVNHPLNPQRTYQQHSEDSTRRRYLEMLVNSLYNTNIIDFEFRKRTGNEFRNYIWEKFDKKCFKCQKNLDFGDVNIDHTMPIAYLYRLDESATCLCKECNSKKRDKFPSEFYSSKELERLSKITGLPIDTLKKKEANQDAVKLLIDKIVWYFDDFLMSEECQKIRDGILTADKINNSINRVIGGECNLADEYRKRTGKYPSSINLN